MGGVRKPDSKIVHIAQAFDEAYLCPAAVTLASVKNALKGDTLLVVHLLHNNLSGSLQTQFTNIISSLACVEINWINVDSFDFSSYRRLNGSLATYFRIFLPQLVPEHLERIVYLDSDLIVLGDISPLFEINLGNFDILAVNDQFPNISKGQVLEKLSPSILHPQENYFNAGVLVFNLNRWRTSNIVELAINALEDHKYNLKFFDQDALNLVCHSGEIERTWNYQVRRDTILDLSATMPAILHFSATEKPWNTSNPTTLQKEWIKHANALNIQNFSGKGGKISQLRFVKALKRLVREPSHFFHDQFQKLLSLFN